MNNKSYFKILIVIKCIVFSLQNYSLIYNTKCDASSVLQRIDMIQRPYFFL